MVKVAISQGSSKDGSAIEIFGVAFGEVLHLRVFSFFKLFHAFNLFVTALVADRVETPCRRESFIETFAIQS